MADEQKPIFKETEIADDQTPVLINLTQIFYEWGIPPKRSLKEFFKDCIKGNPPPELVTGYKAEPVRVNASNIETMSGAANPARLNTSPHPETTVRFISGNGITVQETRDEIKQKIAAALKP